MIPQPNAMEHLKIYKIILDTKNMKAPQLT